MGTTTVQEIIEMAGERLLAVPEAFIQPPHARPRLSHHQPGSPREAALPIVDLTGLRSPLLRPGILHQIGSACADWGFFQVVNHGVSDKVMEEMKAACLRFFNQPASERNKLRSHNFTAPIAYNTSFNPLKDVVRDWKDVLYVRDMPGVSCNGFDLLPEICREAFHKYRQGVEELANVLYEAIFESLGLNSEFMKVLPSIDRVVMAVNYYPPCPDPSLTYGFSGHSDIGSLTILLQDEVPGLQIKKGGDWYLVKPLSNAKGGDWYLVKPLSNAVVVNLADQIEILSNGRYKSIEHRAITNVERPRLSVACFFNPNGSDAIGPLSNFVSESEPALYNEVKYQDYVRSFHSRVLLPDKGSLNLARK